MQKLINRFNALFDQATIKQHIDGQRWYSEAHDHAVFFSKKFDVPLFKVVGVISALSPNNKWNRNLIDTELFLESPDLETKVCTFMGQRQKALDILLNAQDADEVKAILGGEKTKNFFDNILHWEHSDIVTVDTWMYRAAKLPPSKANFRLIHDAIQYAAQGYQLKPHQYQAVVWSVIRTTKETV